MQLTLVAVPIVRNMTPTPDTTASAEESFLLGGELPVRRIGLGTMRLTDATGDGTQAGAHLWRAPADPTAAILSGIVESVPVPSASDSTSIPRGSRA